MANQPQSESTQPTRKRKATTPLPSQRQEPGSQRIEEQKKTSTQPCGHSQSSNKPGPPTHSDPSLNP